MSVKKFVIFNSLSTGIMTGTLGLLLLLLPLAAPLIAQENLEDTIECVYYNRENCSKSQGDCPATEKCTLLNNPQGKSSCYVTWKNTSAFGVVAEMGGCMYHERCKNKNSCESNEAKKNNVSNVPYYYCCCYGNFCNEQYFWMPLPSTPPTRVSTDLQLEYFLFLALGIVILLLSIPCIFYFYRRNKLSTFMELPTLEASTLTHSCVLPAVPKNRSIQLIEVKARGRFGAVWKAKYCSSEVAVKIFPVQDKESWKLEKEIFTLPHMKHDNILHFMGVEERGDTFNAEFWLITAYHDHGSLFDYLKCNVFSWKEVVGIGESMCKGLAFLHNEQNSCSATQGLKPAIAHRDFKSKNVLLKNNLTACIADFGLSVTFYPGQPTGETHGQVGTRRYMAPEVLEGAISFNREAFLPIDIYACGLVLWEIVSRCSAQDGPVEDYKLPFEEEAGLHPMVEDMIELVVKQKKRPKINETWNNHSGLMSIVEMMEDSWDHDAEARVSASCIVERFSLLSRRFNYASLSNIKASY